jgi:Ca2+-binding EF-hand superfamily protein
VEVLRAKDFYFLLESHESLKEGIRDICLRREFKKALCYKLRRDFPKNEKELREAFDAIDGTGSGTIEMEDVRVMLRQFDPTYTEEDVRDILNSLALTGAGNITWAEFSHIFAMEEKSETKK